MALELMKLLVTATTTTETTPTPERFFFVTTTITAPGATLTIDAADFFDDSGTAVTELPALSSGNSLFNVYINGVMQMQDISTYTAGATGVGSLAIDVPAGLSSILIGSPVVLEVINFAPDSTTTIAT
ncbi:DUF4183 domain-containing protein [Paenibacillus sp. HB172176]|uniref:DUF4183 domain-containing protein n=1 Tax=Paenibacillus sp. HB172176 TaxID=2493690 RepID=UPI00143C678F|nr:DUF4183 domain-containing protein [Paenibacillus sp. HB172176]